MENDFLEARDHILERSPLLRTFLDRTAFLDTNNWIEKTNYRYSVIANELHNAFGSTFWELGPKSVFILGDAYGVFCTNLSKENAFAWTNWLIGMGWEIGNPRQILQFLPDIVNTITDFEVFDRNAFVEDGASKEQTRFTWAALSLGAHWKDVSESKTPREFEDFISKMDINLEDGEENI